MGVCNMKIEELKNIARESRINVVKMIAEAGSGHPGGSLSCIEILVALYFAKMDINPAEPNRPDRDRFVLSKGHAAPALYSVLSKRGYFPEEELLKLRQIGGILQGHPDMKKTPGVDMSSGSLGQGLSVANGMALAAKLDQLDYQVYALLGDGELEEGQIWEAVMTAAHYELNNLLVFVDHNRLQIDGNIDEIKSIKNINKRFESFGWETREIDGHSFEELLEVLNDAKTIRKPFAIIANTVKGKGISYMENKVGWHGQAPSSQELEQALLELRKGDSA